MSVDKLAGNSLGGFSMSKACLLLALAAFLGAGLVGCSSGPNAAELCTDAISEAKGAAFSNPEVTENLDRGGAAIDIRGSYDGGTFACGIERADTLILHQVIIYTNDGLAENIVP